MPTPRIRGVLAPVLTPFDSRLEPPHGMLAGMPVGMLDGCSGVAMFPTTLTARSVPSHHALLYLSNLWPGRPRGLS